MTTVQCITITLLLVGLLGCNQQPEQDGGLAKNNVQRDIVSVAPKPDNSKYYIATDTFEFSTETLGTIKYSKEEFNRIVDNQPELFTDYWVDPDKKYHCNGDNIIFGCELCQDDYYVLYAHFLKQQNGIEKYAIQRNKLIDIYTNINILFQNLQYGGTFFGHQYARILGYAEYSVYLYAQQAGNFEKTYDISTQKELYLKSLRQLIADENTIDYLTLGEEKIGRTKALNKIVDELDRLITDIFYLRRTQEFHYGHYEYF